MICKFKVIQYKFDNNPVGLLIRLDKLALNKVYMEEQRTMNSQNAPEVVDPTRH